MNPQVEEVLNTWVRLEAPAPYLRRGVPTLVVGERERWLESLGLSQRDLLYFVAGCVRAPVLMTNRERRHELADLLEDVADGRKGPATLDPVALRKHFTRTDPQHRTFRTFWTIVPLCVFDHSAAVASRAAVCAAHFSADGNAELAPQGALLAGIVGSGWEFDPQWRTDPVQTLAQQMHDAHTFDRMHILADALQDAGCASDWLVTLRNKYWRWCRGCKVIDDCRGGGRQ
jgi:hypothetical protein